MKIRIIDLEGPPEEMAKVPELLEALRGSPAYSLGTNGNGLIPPLGRLPQDFADHIRSRGGNGDRGRRVEAWVSEVLGWGTTEISFGKSKRSPDGYTRYLLMHNLGPHHFGAFVYVFPRHANVTVRLTAEQAKGFDQAMVRKGRYGVMVSLMTDEGYKQALDLARMALAQVQPKGADGHA